MGSEKFNFYVDVRQSKRSGPPSLTPPNGYNASHPKTDQFLTTPLHSQKVPTPRDLYNLVACGVEKRTTRAVGLCALSHSYLQYLRVPLRVADDADTPIMQPYMGRHI